MNHMVARLRLMENRSACDVCYKRVEDIPVRRVVARGQFIAAVPNHANSAGHRSGCHPGEDCGLCLQALANLDRGTPADTFVRRIFNKNVVVIGIADIDGVVGRDLHREEEVVIISRGDRISSIGHWRQTGRGWNTHRNVSSAATDINRAVALIDRDSPRLADCSRGRRGSVSKAPIGRLLDLRDGRLESAIKEVNNVRTVKLQPLPVVSGHATGSVANWVRRKGRAAIG
jgi:hypothetical protein